MGSPIYFSGGGVFLSLFEGLLLSLLETGKPEKKHEFIILPIQLLWHPFYACGMCYPVCGMVHIKEPLLFIRKSSGP